MTFKPLRITLLVALIIFCHTFALSQADIGVNKNGKYSITSSLSKIKKEWGSLLTAQGVTEELSFFEIRKQKDLVSKENYYMLIGKGSTDSVKIGTKLLYKSKKFYLPSKGITYIVSCIGHSSACIPNMADGNWICGENPDGKCFKNASECTKTITATE